HAALVGPKIEGSRTWCVWLNVFNDAAHTATRWNAYVVEADPAKCLGVLAGRTSVRVVLEDKDGQVVTEDEFEVRDNFRLTGDIRSEEILDRAGWNPSEETLLPLLYQARVRNRDGSNLQVTMALDRLWTDREQDPDYSKQYAENLYVAPYSFTVK